LACDLRVADLQPLVELARGDQAGRVGGYDERVPVGLADLDGYVLTPLRPLQADHAALGVDGDPVTGDQGDGVMAGQLNGACCALLGLRRRRAGHAGGEGDGGGRGNRGRACSFHLSAQVSPLLKYRVNSPFTRPGVVCTDVRAPRNRQYAGG
jgi:hypothetical protein